MILESPWRPQGIGGDGWSWGDTQLPSGSQGLAASAGAAACGGGEQSTRGLLRSAQWASGPSLQVQMPDVALLNSQYS